MRIASIVDDLSLSQNAFYMIKSFNKLGRDLNIQPFCFYNNLSSLTTTPLFSIAHVYYANYFYNGKIICTNLNTLKILNNIHTNSRKFFYVWDLEWLRDKYDYMSNIKLMRNKNIELIARSDYHAKKIKEYCNKLPTAIIEDWDSEKLRVL